jgi:hypothetical protein
MEKPNPELFLEAMKDYLNRLTIKKIIPIPYENAKSETYFSMLDIVPKEQHEVFEKAIMDFEAITDVEGWYND